MLGAFTQHIWQPRVLVRQRKKNIPFLLLFSPIKVLGDTSWGFQPSKSIWRNMPRIWSSPAPLQHFFHSGPQLDFSKLRRLGEGSPCKAGEGWWRRVGPAPRGLTGQGQEASCGLGAAFRSQAPPSQPRQLPLGKYLRGTAPGRNWKRDLAGPACIGPERARNRL